MPKLAPVGRIQKRNHDHYGKEVVIQWETPKMYHVRVLGERVPLEERFSAFSLDDKSLAGVKNHQVSFYIRKGNVDLLPGREAPKLLNTWSCETGGILEAFSGKTKEEIEKALGKKLIFS